MRPRQFTLLNEHFEFMVGLSRADGGSLPSVDDYHRAEDMGITIGHVGPIEHMLGKLYPMMDKKKKTIEEFANRVLRQ